MCDGCDLSATHLESDQREENIKWLPHTKPFLPMFYVFILAAKLEGSLCGTLSADEEESCRRLGGFLLCVQCGSMWWKSDSGPDVSLSQTCMLPSISPKLGDKHIIDQTMQSELTIFIHPLFPLHQSQTLCYSILWCTCDEKEYESINAALKYLPEVSKSTQYLCLWVLVHWGSGGHSLWASLAANGVSGKCFVFKPFGDQQAQHALGTQSTHWTAFKYTRSQDTLAILCWVTLSGAQSLSSLLNSAPRELRKVPSELIHIHISWPIKLGAQDRNQPSKSSPVPLGFLVSSFPLKYDGWLSHPCVF